MHLDCQTYDHGKQTRKIWHIIMYKVSKLLLNLVDPIKFLNFKDKKVF